MNYRHIYHAGNFADVFKHCILTLLAQNFLHKDKSFCYVETHAGIARYDLLSEEAQKTSEYLTGIAPILNSIYNTESTSTTKHLPPPEELAPYFTAIKQLNKNLANPTDLRFYPGSPYLVRSLLRPQDRMILMELHKEDVLILKKEFANDKQVAVHHCDGYQGLKAFLPPPIKRGLVLIDPSFEQKDEFEKIIAALTLATSRWSTATYAVWYPIKDTLPLEPFLKKLHALHLPILINEITINNQTTTEHPPHIKPTTTNPNNTIPDRTTNNLTGCGMAIINPPWKFEEQLNRVLPWLHKTLSITHRYM
jgi:23S rRNA (adenine2030-N6)-methyltransferase